jgi:hypothetical protein
MFPTGDDLPLFSGTPMRAQVEEFKPEAVEEQPTLFTLPRPEMRPRRRPIAAPPATGILLPIHVTAAAVAEAAR